MGTYTIGELAKQTGLTPRTIRYYVEIGLLPPPEGTGRAAGYGPEHLQRLWLIKRLQNARLSLEEIRDQLPSLESEATPAPEGSSFRSAQFQLSETPSSAGDYLEMVREQLAMPPPSAQPPPQDKPQTVVSEPWARIPLSPDVELHVRRRGNRIDPRLAKLIKEAQRILYEEEEPK
jgi:DNA-binding transcriptional MerR regulator